MYSEFKFFSLNKKSDWDKGWYENCQAVEDGFQLKSSDKYAVSLIIRQEDVEVYAKISDCIVGRHGQVFFLDEEANLWLYDYQNQHNEILLKSGHDLFSGAAVLAYSRDIIFLADPYAKHKISAFSLLNGQPVWTIEKSGDNVLLPLAISVGDGNHLYVLTPLDTIAGKKGNIEVPAGGRLGIVKIDLYGKIVDVFKNEYLTVKESKSLASLRNTLYFTLSKDNMVYILNTEAKSLLIISPDSGNIINFPLNIFTMPSGLAVDWAKNIYIGDFQGVGPDIDYNRSIFKISSLDKTAEELTGYHGRTDKLFTDSQNALYIWNKESSTITILEMKTRMLELGDSGIPQGVYVSTSLDSTVEEMSWHKVFLDARIPEDTQLKVSYFSSDRQEFIINTQKRNLDEFIKDDSVFPPEKIQFLEPFWSQPIINAEDALLHNARGRYLWLKIEFIGTEDKSPLLKKIRVYYPRMSYLSYLPAVYQEDKESRDFLERFLSLFATFFLNMEENIFNIARTFDADAVSGPFLQWLAGWLAIDVGESWNEKQIREVINKAPELYKKRGTRHVIESLIEIFTGEKPIIVEYFQFKNLMEQPEIKKLMGKLYGDDPYCFYVLVKQENVSDTSHAVFLQKILNEEKPAFTEARLIVLQPWIYMDMHTYLGINTYLSELSLLRLDQKSSIPYNAVLTDLDRESGINTYIETDVNGGRYD